MTRGILNFVVSVLLAMGMSMFLPWYAIMLAAFLAGILVPLRGVAAFVVPFLAIAILWMGHGWWLSSENDFILAKKIAVLFPLGGSDALLMLFTGVVGGTAAGVAGVFGTTTHGLFTGVRRRFTR